MTDSALDTTIRHLAMFVDDADKKLSESGDARRFAELRGHLFRFVPAWATGKSRGKWLAWDGSRYTTHNATNLVGAAVAETAKGLYDAAKDVLHAIDATLDDAGRAMMRQKPSERNGTPEFEALAREWDKAQRIQAWAEKGESAKRIKAAAELAEAIPFMVVSPSDLDADGYLFNCTNGVVDLRTGKLHAPTPDMLITQCAGTHYDTMAPAPLWTQFLKDTLLEQDVIDFYQRYIGYCMLGVVVEHSILFHTGEGSNGKGVAHTTLLKAFGDYGHTVGPEVLLEGKGDAHPTSIAQFYGKRWVNATEPPKTRKLDEAMVKRLTGGDVLSCRRMGEDFWNFRPSHTLSMEANDLPVIHGQDNGIWRRVLQLQWRVSFVDPQESAEERAKKARLAAHVRNMVKGLDKQLAAELPGILAWCVRGCLAWQHAGGLNPPESVRVSVAEYRASQNTLEVFLRECTTADPDSYVVKNDLYPVYVQWCKESGEKYPMTGRGLAVAMRREGFGVDDRDVTGTKRIWNGIRLTQEIGSFNNKLIAVQTPPQLTAVRKIGA